MKKIIISLLGAFGIIPTAKLKYKKSDKEKFTKELTKGSVLLTRKRVQSIKELGFWKWLSNFFGRAIQVVTGSHWSHTVIYLGKIDGKHTIVESLAKVEYRNLDDYLTDEYQVKAWSRPLTAAEQRIISREARKWEGKLYDIFEIAYHVFGTPHPDNLVVCASLAREIFKQVEILGEPEPSPGDLEKYFKKSKHWSSKTFNY